MDLSRCTIINQQALTLAVCQPPAETWWSKFGPTVPSVALSLLAIVLAVRTFLYNRSKDQRAREQSIQDDYWLRKVVSPLSIEPFLKFSQEISRDLPGAAGSTDEIVQAFWTTNVGRVGEFEVAFQALGLIEDSLVQAVGTKLESFEDVLARYSGDLQAHLKDPSTAVPDRSAASKDLVRLTLELLKLIQLHQANVGGLSAQSSAWYARLWRSMPWRKR